MKVATALLALPVLASAYTLNSCDYAKSKTYDVATIREITLKSVGAIAVVHSDAAGTELTMWSNTDLPLAGDSGACDSGTTSTAAECEQRAHVLSLTGVTAFNRSGEGWAPFDNHTGDVDAAAPAATPSVLAASVAMCGFAMAGGDWRLGLGLAGLGLAAYATAEEAGCVNTVIVVPSMFSTFDCWNTTRASDFCIGLSVRDGYRLEDPVVFYTARHVLPEYARAGGLAPPMEVGTAANMDPKLKELGIDFEGIWWMSDNPVPEELVSFANTEVNLTNGTFPATLMVPNSRKGMWAWQTTTVGTLLRKYYSTGDPDAHTDFVFESTTKGKITTGLTGVPIVWVESFPFFKYAADCDVTSAPLPGEDGYSADAATNEAAGKFNCDPTDCAPKARYPGVAYNGTCADLIRDYPNDMWSRPTLFQDRSWFDDTTYTLKRIVMGDGSRHPVFWDEWMEHTKSETVEECEWGWPTAENPTGQTCTTVAGGVRGEMMLQSYMSDTWCDRQASATWGMAGC